MDNCRKTYDNIDVNHIFHTAFIKIIYIYKKPRQIFAY